MKVAKLIVLLGGLLGVLGFFVPLATVRDQSTELSLSGYQLFSGMTELEDVANRANASKDLETLGEIKGIILVCFLPGALLAVVGLVGVARRQFGRPSALVAIALGVLSFLVFMAMQRGAAEAQHGTAGPAVYLLAACGLLGIAGGSLAVVNPDRRT